MIAINWFEVLLPSMVFGISVERLEDPAHPPRREKSIEHRTVLRSADAILYHITTSPPDGTEVVEIDFREHPSIAKYIIEHGFAAQLQKADFEVSLRHVGGVGYRSVDSSARPTIYRSMEGMRFRCFYGFDREGPIRWGLILSYVTSQRFIISVRDTRLRELAVGKQVVPLSGGSSDIGRRSGILKSVQNGQAVLIDQEGNEDTVSLDDWTLPCRRDNLLNYIKLVEDARSVSDVATKLQQEALTLTSEGRMNTALARDQLKKLQALMAENDLLAFRLPLPERPLARVSREPFIVGD